MRIIALLFLAAIVGPCFAQFTSTGGPINTQGQCWALWAEGQTAFMGFDNNLYRTTDGGASWDLLNNGIPEGCDPRTIESTGGVIVVGTNDDQRLYLSNDGGDSWTGSTSNPLLVPTASAVAGGKHFIGGTLNEPSEVDPTTGDLTPTGASGTLTHGLNHVGPDEIWQAAGSVFGAETRYSTDAGETWTALDQEPQVDIGGGLLWPAVPQDFVRCGDRIVAGTDLNGFPVIYSDDNGASWTPGDLGSTTYSDYGKRFVKVSDDHLLTTNLSGIWKSTDQGATWTLIQTLAEVRTMVLFNDDHLLVGTDQGVCEFANYGEGDLVAKHGAPGGAASLAVQDGQVWTAAGGTLQAYNTASGAWDVLQNVTADGQPLPSGALTIAGDSVYILGAPLAAAHVDVLDFTLRSSATFGGQTTTTLADFGSVKLVGTQNGFTTGSIYRSTDGGTTYTTASFSNTVAFGYAGLSGNYPEHFWQVGSTLWADMNAGYAVSTDDGVNWTFYGDTWDDSYLMVHDGAMFRFNIGSFDASQRTLATSTDDGASWTELALDGIPGASAFFGVYSANGGLHTHHFEGDAPGLYTWNGAGWTLTEGTDEAPAEDMQALVYADGAFYGAWAQSGVWTSGEVQMQVGEHTLQAGLYPNPAHTHVRLDTEAALVTISDLRGVAQEMRTLGNGELDVSGYPAGIYLVHLEQNGARAAVRLVVQR